ncbi:similar to guanine nucleotide exchange factor [Cyanidioschyzon merolae strain 10D]|uniref:Similar to guanine nucleotide exchange factor n=1 Tax=Cyanidioschyzon merolae (strain NIES-3377 / 10D) TaxID=280699 RepID=M1V4Y7_CYAM1|nr:similar to guanine nucleotide exchange factor [Cyanidioschyzon merolae strain 10D]BAM79760.1 similar to guanine nucleotide exchange factor [Cyanidioschyzon merolae strain 10D]|eukprot:XP_005536046.1 similar to guanine nucleotide exchange factor [Cyanidioschyzon merolae strain 10D]
MRFADPKPQASIQTPCCASQSQPARFEAIPRPASQSCSAGGKAVSMAPAKSDEQVVPDVASERGTPQRTSLESLFEEESLAQGERVRSQVSRLGLRRAPPLASQGDESIETAASLPETEVESSVQTESRQRSESVGVTVDLEQVYNRLRDSQTGLQLADRRWRLITYSRCFVGSEAVQWMQINLGISREEAIDLGQRLMDAGLFHHVTYSEPFRDGNFFYAFQEDEESNVLNTKLIWDPTRRPRDPVVVAKELITRLALLCEVFRHPSNANEVDFESLRSSDAFRKYTFAAAELQRVDLGPLSPEERLCFFCNVYNALCLHAHVVHGPPNTVLRRWSFFKSLSYRIAGMDFTLDDIEHGVLRGNQTRPYGLIRQFRPGDPRMQYVLSRRDPRIHFVISAGTQSDPPMRILDGENIDEELHFATESFLEESCKVSASALEVTLPRIFSWYRDDFAKGNLELLRWILPYLGLEKRRALESMLDNAKSDSSISIRYEAFTWNAGARFSAAIVRRKRRRLEQERASSQPPADEEPAAATAASPVSSKPA